MHPLADRAFAWVCAPSGPRRSDVGLCWGDPRPGNIIWRDATPVCVTDFEAASIAPPELDVGWWLMFDRTMHEWAGIERAEGDPTRAEQLRMYEAASGRAVPDAQWFEICAAARYCAIVVRVMNRAVDRGLHARGPHHLAGEPRQLGAGEPARRALTPGQTVLARIRLCTSG